ncbi:MAG: IPT/TIG domain-containing protein [Deltaproteobacteria bacterium]|nr:IPT/TIG domain-containing protein [Deltaproteobacteria bacterium]
MVRVHWVLGCATLVFMLTSCSVQPAGPVIISVEPKSGSKDQDVDVTVHGQNFFARLEANYDDELKTKINQSFTVFIGGTQLPSVALVDPNTLHTVVPKGSLTMGRYAVEVVGPRGFRTRLLDAYEVTAFPLSDSGFDAGLDGAPDTTPPPDTTPDTTPPDTTPPDTTPPDTTHDSAPLPCAGQTCPLGCHVALDRCARLVASNFDASAMYGKATAKTVTSASTMQINTDTGQILDGSKVIRPPGSPGQVLSGVYWGLVPQSGYADLSLFGFASLTISAKTTAGLIGRLAAVIHVAENVEIAGTLQALPSGATPVAGGRAGGAAAADAPSCFLGHGKRGIKVDSPESGGGGGARGAQGGDGGDTDTGAIGGEGGIANGSVALLSLYGGCGGGGGGNGIEGGAGGAGGGVLQISADGAVVVSGTIHMPGAGGAGSSGIAAGGGGGSGGGILLEGATITLTGLLAANGGGGGGGTYGHGMDGQASTLAAAGGGPATTYAAVGGPGGALAKPAGTVGDQGYSGGGGGGSVGRIRLNASTITISSSNASPVSSRGSINTW